MTPGSFSVMAMVLTFAAVALLGGRYVEWIKGQHVGQTVRTEGPKTHYVKSGTPTFGGLMFTVPLLLAGLIWAFGAKGEDSGLLRSSGALALTLYILGNAAVGFADDFVKVRISKKGLSAIQKTLPMLAVIFLFVLYYLFLFPGGPVIIIPFTDNIVEITGWWKLLYGILAFLYLYYIGNSVNFTDGVDGLLSSVSIPVLLTLAVLASRLPLPDRGSVTVLSLTLAAGLAGYLIYNRHPARIFMGDTGSLAIGALAAGAALLMGAPWLMILAGVIYWIESLTVMIQMTYFRYTHGKRIFRMTPIHHHFELGGWSENKIVLVFTAVTVIGCLLSFVTLWQFFR